MSGEDGLARGRSSLVPEARAEIRVICLLASNSYGSPVIFDLPAHFLQEDSEW